MIAQAYSNKPFFKSNQNMQCHGERPPCASPCHWNFNTSIFNQDGKPTCKIPLHIFTLDFTLSICFIKHFVVFALIFGNWQLSIVMFFNGQNKFLSYKTYCYWRSESLIFFIKTNFLPIVGMSQWQRLRFLNWNIHGVNNRLSPKRTLIFNILDYIFTTTGVSQISIIWVVDSCLYCSFLVKEVVHWIKLNGWHNIYNLSVICQKNNQKVTNIMAKKTSVHLCIVHISCSCWLNCSKIHWKVKCDFLWVIPMYTPLTLC